MVVVVAVVVLVVVMVVVLVVVVVVLVVVVAVAVVVVVVVVGVGGGCGGIAILCVPFAGTPPPAHSRFRASELECSLSLCACSFLLCCGGIGLTPLGGKHPKVREICNYWSEARRLATSSV